MHLKDLSKIIFNPLLMKGVKKEDPESLKITVQHHLLGHNMFCGSIQEFQDYCASYRNHQPVVVEILVDRTDERNISDSIKNKIIKII